MWLKITRSFLALILLTSLVYISGCIEEPTIDPVKRTFSVTRLGNFSYNADVINVKIINSDGTAIEKNNIAKNQITDYFDIESGSRKVIVTNSSNDTLLQKNITFISYEEGSVLFTGYYSKSNLENTYTYVSYPEGDTYVEEKPAAGEAWLHFIHVSVDSNVDTTKAVLMHVTMKNASSTPQDTATLFSTIGSISYAYKSLEFGSYRSTKNSTLRGYRDTLSLNGNMLIDFLNSANTKQVLVSHTTTIEAGYQYYYFVTGIPKKDAMQIVEVKQLPLAARSKWLRKIYGRKIC